MRGEEENAAAARAVEAVLVAGAPDLLQGRGHLVARRILDVLMREHGWRPTVGCDLTPPALEQPVVASAAVLATPLEAAAFVAAWNEHRGRLPEVAPLGRGTLGLLRAALARERARHAPAWWGALAARAARAPWCVQAMVGMEFFLARKDGEVRIDRLLSGGYDKLWERASARPASPTDSTAEAQRQLREQNTERARREAAERAAHTPSGMPAAVRDLLPAHLRRAIERDDERKP